MSANEELHSIRMTLGMRMDAVTDLDPIPTEQTITALVQVIHALTGLLSRLAASLAFEGHIEARFLIETIREALTRLHLEVQLLRRECRTGLPLTGGGWWGWRGWNWLWQERVTRALPTRSLLEQQLLVSKQGECVLSHLDDLQRSLRSLSADSSLGGSANDEPGG